VDSVFSGVKVTYVASCVPKNQINLNDLSPEYGEKETKKIILSTGISKIRVAEKSTTTADLCFAAANKIFVEGGIDRTDVDAIVFMSQTPDYVLPATSVTLQHRLGLSKNVVAFDISYGCTAYIYGLLQASLLISSGSCKKVLMLAGDVMTRYVHPMDRSVRMVFGDGGSATLLEKGDDDIGFIIKSDGAGAEHLIIPAGGMRLKNNKDSSKETERENGNVRSDENIFMNGMEIMNFCIREIPRVLEDALVQRKWVKEEVGLYGLHQANKFMVSYLAKKSGLPPGSFPITMGEIGNTGPASIPIMLTQNYGQLRKESRLEKTVLCGFGVGLSWGTATLNLAETHFYDPLEI
jgi:3-oxoacyl-[acyl-carrier-protein] synthase III